MTERVHLRCKNCGHPFETEVLDKVERREARHENRPVKPVP